MNSRTYNSTTRLNNQIAKILFPTEAGHQILELNLVIRCEAGGSYTTIHTQSNCKPFVSSYNLAYFEKILLSKGFFRTHRSHFVNLEKVSSVYHRGKSGIVELIDGSSVPLAADRKACFLESLRQYFHS